MDYSIMESLKILLFSSNNWIDLEWRLFLTILG